MCGASAFLSYGSGGSEKAIEFSPWSYWDLRRENMPRPRAVSTGARRSPLSGQDALHEELLDESLGIRRELEKNDAHAGRAGLDTDDLAYALGRLDVIHDHGEPEVHSRPDREGLLRLDEDAGARNVRHVLLDERVERLKLLVDRDSLVPSLVGIAHRSLPVVRVRTSISFQLPPRIP